MPTRAKFFLLLLLVAIVLPFVHADVVEHKYDTVSMDIKGKPFTIEIAEDEPTRTLGLMNRPSMPADRGMVFVFDTVDKYHFWMHNTLIDLDIIWLSPSGKVLEIVTLKAHDEVGGGGREPALYVIELNAGTAGTLGLKVGDTVPIPKRLVKPTTQPAQ